MTTGTWNPFAGDAAPPAGRRRNGRALVRHAVDALSNWWAASMTRPVYYRLGAFDAARSSVARQLLERRRR